MIKVLLEDSSKKEKRFKVAIFIEGKKVVPLNLANELLSEGRRNGFRLEVHIYSDLEPPESVAALLPLITQNHSITLSILPKKLDEKVEKALSNQDVDLIYIESSLVGKLKLDSANGARNIKYFTAQGDPLEA